MAEHDRKNLELLYQTHIQFILMWVGAALTAIVLSSIASYQVEGTTRILVLIVGIVSAIISTIRACFNRNSIKRIEKALGMDTTIANYLKPKRK